MPVTLPPPLKTLIEGTPIESMEVAKEIIGDKIQVDPKILAQLSLDKKLRHSSRIAAIYALGLVGEPALGAALRKVLADHTDDIDVREHSTEALGNIGDISALDLLHTVLTAESNPKLRKSCEFAIRELSQA